MIRYLISLLFIALILGACQNKNQSVDQAIPEVSSPEPINFKTAEQSKAELEEIAFRDAMKFNIIYVGAGERIYIQKNRITHFKFPDDASPTPVHQNVLADFDQIERYKDQIRKSGILGHKSAGEELKGAKIELQLDGKSGLVYLSEISDSKFKKAMDDLISGLKEISKTMVTN